MRLTATSFFFAAVTLLACAGLPNMAFADKVQGFENGDPAVSSIGDAGTVGTFQGQGAPEGSNQFLLTTIGSMSNEDTISSQSGVFAVGNMTLQNFFGLSIAGNEGSGVLIPFTVGVGQTLLTFQYDFLSNEVFQMPVRDDFAFAAVFDSGGGLEGSVNNFASVLNAPNAFGLFNGQTPFQFHTGLNNFNMSLGSLAPGNYMLGIGLADRTTADHASGILIDNVQVVPEPSVIALAVAGAGLMLGVRRRIKRS